MQRSGSREGTSASADGICAAQAHDSRRQSAFTGNHREKRSPASDGGNRKQNIIRRKNVIVKRETEKLLFINLNDNVQFAYEIVVSMIERLRDYTNLLLSQTTSIK